VQGWVDDAGYPSGMRLPMSPQEFRLVDADAFAKAADELEALENPTPIEADVALYLARAARLLRLGID
jgi:hypothetical protein